MSATSPSERLNRAGFTKEDEQHSIYWVLSQLVPLKKGGNKGGLKK